MARIRDGIAFAADVVGLGLGIVTVVAAVITFGSLAVSKLAEGDARQAALRVAVVTGAGLVGAVIGGLAMFFRHRYVARGYRWVRAEYTYSIDATNTTKHVAETRVTIKATRDNVRIFENRYSWSGTGVDPLPVSGDPGQQVLTPAIADSAWRHYFVGLRQPLARGESTTFVLRQNFEDTGGTFQPFYGKAIVEPVGSLALRVRLPPGTQLVSARLTHRKSSALAAKVVSVTDALTSYDPLHGEINWVVSGKPKRGHHYRIDWQE